GPDPRAEGGACDRRGGELPGASHLRLPPLSRFRPADAPLRLPALAGADHGARRAGARLGPPGATRRLSDAAGGQAPGGHAPGPALSPWASEPPPPGLRSSRPSTTRAARPTASWS